MKHNLVCAKILQIVSKPNTNSISMKLVSNQVKIQTLIQGSPPISIPNFANYMNSKMSSRAQSEKSGILGSWIQVGFRPKLGKLRQDQESWRRLGKLRQIRKVHPKDFPLRITPLHSRKKVGTWEPGSKSIFGPNQKSGGKFENLPKSRKVQTDQESSYKRLGKLEVKKKQEHKVSYRCSLPSPSQERSQVHQGLHRIPDEFQVFWKNLWSLTFLSFLCLLDCHG